MNKGEEVSFEAELAQDVLEIITVFSARLYGSRSRKNKKLIEAAKVLAGDRWNDFNVPDASVLSQEQEHILQAYAALLSSVQHKLYAAVAKGRKPAACKNEFLKKFDITVRQFN